MGISLAFVIYYRAVAKVSNSKYRPVSMAKLELSSNGDYCRNIESKPEGLPIVTSVENVDEENWLMHV